MANPIIDIPRVHLSLHPQPATAAFWGSYLVFLETGANTQATVFCTALPDGAATPVGGNRQFVVNSGNVAFTSTTAGSLEAARNRAATLLLDALIASLPSAANPAAPGASTPPYVSPWPGAYVQGN